MRGELIYSPSKSTLSATTQIKGGRSAAAATRSCLCQEVHPSELQRHGHRVVCLYTVLNDSDAHRSVGPRFRNQGFTRKEISNASHENIRKGGKHDGYLQQGYYHARSLCGTPDRGDATGHRRCRTQSIEC